MAIIQGGWLQNWLGTLPPFISIENVNSKYNTIFLAFAMIDNQGNVTFDSTNIPKVKIQQAQAKNQKVILSLGGATNHPVITDLNIGRTNFVNTLRDLVVNLGVDGIDIDLEGVFNVSNSTPLGNPQPDITTECIISGLEQLYNLPEMTNKLLTISGEVANVFLSRKIETGETPQWGTSYGGIYGSYLPLLYRLRNKITKIQIQMYNVSPDTTPTSANSMLGNDGINHYYTPSTYNDFVVNCVKLLKDGFNVTTINQRLDGFSDDKIGISMLSTSTSGSNGYRTDTQITSLLNDIKTAGINLGSVSLWSINWSSTDNNLNINAIDTFFNANQPIVDNNIKNTINVLGEITPLSTEDTYPIVSEQYVKGGYRAVSSILERDNIPMERRKQAMLVHVIGEEIYYELASDLVTWVKCLIPKSPTENAEIKYLNGNLEWKAIEIPASSTGGANNLYFTNQNSTTVPTYNKLSYTYDPTPIIKTTVANNGMTLMGNYIYDSPVGITKINSGTWTFTIFGKLNSNASVSTIIMEVYKRYPNGTETTLFQMESLDINNTTDEFISMSSVQPLIEIEADCQLGRKLYFKTTRTSNVTLTYVVGGTNSGFSTTSLPSRHSTLRNLNEDPLFQHVTTDQVNKINNIGDLTQLKTTDKTVVGAINELYDLIKVYHP